MATYFFSEKLYQAELMYFTDDQEITATHYVDNSTNPYRSLAAAIEIRSHLYIRLKFSVALAE